MPQINIDEPRWDQNTYWGRAKFFFATTNPLNLLCSSAELDKAKDTVTKYRLVYLFGINIYFLKILKMSHFIAVNIS